MASYYTIGSKGDDVKKLQQALADAGYSVGKSGIDGIYGKDTQAAVTAYQKDKGLKVDGIAGVETLGSLYTPAPTVAPAVAPTAKVDPDAADRELARQIRDAQLAGTQPAGTQPVQTIDSQIPALNNLNLAPPVAYTSPYEDLIKSSLDKLLSYNASAPYNVATDPLYEPMKQQYADLGQSAFNTQIGKLSAMTGGRPSTASVGAATQAQNAYAKQFASNVLPSLISAEQTRRQNEYANLANQLAALQGLESTEYGKYRDTRGDYESDRAYGRGVLESDRAFDRNVLESDRAYDRNVLESDRAYDYQATRDNVLDDRYMQQFDYQKQRDLIEDAFTNRQISTTERNAALNQLEFNFRKEQAAIQAQQAAKQAEQPTPGQLANYYDVLGKLQNNGKTPAENLRYMETMGKQTYVDLMGENLYQQLVNNLQTKPQERQPLFDSKDYYKQAQDMKKNYESDESIIGYILSANIDEQDQAEILTALGYTDADVDRYMKSMSTGNYMGEFKTTERNLGQR